MMGVLILRRELPFHKSFFFSGVRSTIQTTCWILIIICSTAAAAVILSEDIKQFCGVSITHNIFFSLPYAGPLRYLKYVSKFQNQNDHSAERVRIFFCCLSSQMNFAGHGGDPLRQPRGVPVRGLLPRRRALQRKSHAQIAHSLPGGE